MCAKAEEQKTSLATATRPLFSPSFLSVSFHFSFLATFNVVHSTILSPKLRCICLNELSVYAYVCIEKSLSHPPIIPPLSLFTTHETTNQTKTDMKLKDLTATMAVIVRVHVKNFQSDFIYDKARLRECTLSGSDNDEVTEPFIWMTREMGTTFCYLCDLKNDESSTAREHLLHDYSDQLPSYYVYQDGELHHISQERVKEIIKQYTK